MEYLPTQRSVYRDYPPKERPLARTFPRRNVDAKFAMLVPIYLELDDGKMAFLGRARMVGSASHSQKVPLMGLKTKPRRAAINYYDDVLASN